MSFVEPRSARALAELRSLPGVMAVEPIRTVPARLRVGHRSRQLAITGQLAAPDLSRVRRPVGRGPDPPSGGARDLEGCWARCSARRPGDRVTVEVLEGARPVREVTVSRLVDDYMGLAAYMEIGALHRLMREGDSLSGAHLLVDRGRRRRVLSPARSHARRRRRRHLREDAGQLPWPDGGELHHHDRASTWSSPRSSPSASSTTPPASRSPSAAASWPACACSASRSARSRSCCSASWPCSPSSRSPPGLLVGWGLAELLLLAFQNEVYRLPLVVTPQNAAWSALVGDRGRRALGPRGAPQAGPPRPRRRAQDPGVAP